MANEYIEHVEQIEGSLGRFAFRSRDISRFTDGTDALKYFSDQWRTSGGEARLRGRTPLMLERDRILYSDELRRQADKHHVLFNRNHHVSRDYTTHTLRVAHVARSAARRLDLNYDLAEAIALGCKVGGVPFLHVAKTAVDQWVREALRALDKGTRPGATPTQQFLLELGEDGTLAVPSWLSQLHDEELKRNIARALPWAAGSSEEPAYSSGSQSYWALSTKPFTMSVRAPYAPQTMYGVWRHSLAAGIDARTFRHSIDVLSGEQTVRLSLTEEDLTNEAVLVRYADDITWVVENLSEADRAAALAGGRNTIFGELGVQLSAEDPPDALQLALQPLADTGRIYTYFIDDLIRTSALLMDEADAGHLSETEPVVGLSATGGRMLRLLKQFLETRVFREDRVRLRNNTLSVISTTILEMLYESQGAALIELVERRARVEAWTTAQLERALSAAADPVKRVQGCVDAFSMMSDREVYDFIGLEGS